MNGAHRYVPRGLAVLAHGESNLHTRPDVRQQSREVVVVALRNLDAAVKVPSGDYRVSSLRLTLKDPKSGSAWGYIFGDNGGKASRWHRLDTSATLTIDPIGRLDFTAAIGEGKREGRAGELLSVSLALYTGDGLLIERELPHILKYAPNAVDRQTALNRMLEGTPPESAVQAVVAAVRADKRQFPALRSAGQLGELKRADLRPLFREQLAHPNPNRRVQAIRSLARLTKDQADTEALRGLVNDQELYAVVRASLAALQDWDAPGNRDVFERATRMKSPSDVIRLAAHDALIKADADEGKERPDPDPQTTKVVKDCLSDIAKGVKDSSVMTPKMQDYFIPRGTPHTARWLKELKSFTFLVRDDVQGRMVQRRGTEVSRICSYKMLTGWRESPGGNESGWTTIYLTFYLTAEGTVADLVETS